MNAQLSLEQEIFKCWNITSDIEVLVTNWDELDEDQKLNILIGLKDLYEIKFDQLFSTFEKMLREIYQKKSPEEDLSTALDDFLNEIENDEWVSEVTVEPVSTKSDSWPFPVGAKPE